MSFELENRLDEQFVQGWLVARAEAAREDGAARRILDSAVSAVRASSRACLGDVLLDAIVARAFETARASHPVLAPERMLGAPPGEVMEATRTLLVELLRALRHASGGLLPVRVRAALEDVGGRRSRAAAELP